MNPYARASFHILGIICLIVGVVGLFLPFLQGILFLALGIYLLSKSSPRFKAWFAANISRFPRLEALIAKAKAQLHRIYRGTKSQ
jgi:uncharacterized protein